MKGGACKRIVRESHSRRGIEAEGCDTLYEVVCMSIVEDDYSGGG